MKRAGLLLSLLLALLLAGCAADAPEPVQTTAPPSEPVVTATAPTEPEVTETTAPPSCVDTLMAGMTLRQKVGQLFIVTPEALDPGALTDITVWSDAMQETLADYSVGGVILFARNITGPEQVTAFNAALQNASAIPLFLCVDEEGGAVARLANNRAFDLPRYKSAAAVGSSGDSADALEMGRTIGGYLSEYGFNLDFAPVADVNTNPANPVIGSRAFSSDAATAAEMADAMAQGLREMGIIPVFKHFPGHGDTAQDSHQELAVSYKTMDELCQCEWLPFLRAGSTDCIMVGHIALPGVTGDLTPATLSPEIVTGILKQDLDFGGLVITDSLSMEAITDSLSPGEAALAALNAGCDILLMPEDLPEAYNAVFAAVKRGEISADRLDAAVRRILELKAAYGLIRENG